MIQIKYGSRSLSSDELHAMGWALIDAGKTQDRYAIQLAQSQAGAARKVSRILEGFRK